MRGIRKAVRKSFNDTKAPNDKGEINFINKGKHHWLEDKWLDKARTFLNEKGIKKVSDFDVAITAILLYPALGPNTKKDEKDKAFSNSRVFKTLAQNDAMVVFKYIFKNNNKDLLSRFFNHPFILKIWNIIIKPNLTPKVCFGNNGPENIHKTFVIITE